MRFTAKGVQREWLAEDARDDICVHEPPFCRRTFEEVSNDKCLFGQDRAGAGGTQVDQEAWHVLVRAVSDWIIPAPLVFFVFDRVNLRSKSEQRHSEQ